jgi:hypothetical protein
MAPVNKVVFSYIRVVLLPGKIEWPESAGQGMHSGAPLKRFTFHGKEFDGLRQVA